MGTKLNPQDASAYESLDRLLFREWDPMGLSHDFRAEEEYRMALPDVWRLVTSGADASLLIISAASKPTG